MFLLKINQILFAPGFIENTCYNYRNEEQIVYNQEYIHTYI